MVIVPVFKLVPLWYLSYKWLLTNAQMMDNVLYRIVIGRHHTITGYNHRHHRSLEITRRGQDCTSLPIINCQNVGLSPKRQDPSVY